MKQLITILLFLLQLGTTHAQEHVWKRDVILRICLEDGAVSMTKKSDSSFLASLFNAVTKGNVPAYADGNYYTDTFFSQKLSSEYIESMKHLNIAEVRQYKIYEKWIFDPLTFKTEIHLSGIAPAIRTYNEDSSFRAMRPLFWCKFSDINNILKINVLTQQNNCILTGLLHDQMFDIPRIIEMGVPEDTVVYKLTDISPDTPITVSLVNKIRAKQIDVFDSKDSMLAKKLTVNEFNKPFQWKYREGGNYGIGPTEPDCIFYRNYSYKILEYKKYDLNTFVITITPLAIAPQLIQYCSPKIEKEPGNMFWIKFNDFKTILPKYEQYHPTNTFAQKLWQSYFQTPEYVH
jgi:hypothetical protein